MSGSLPRDREALRSRATFQVALGAFGIGSGLAMLTGALEYSDTGWTGAVPEPLRPVIAFLLVLIGFCFAVPGLVWMLVPLRGPRPPAVHFEPTHIAIRGSLVPKTFLVDRSSVSEVHLRTLSKWCPPSFGLAPMVVVRTVDGRGRGIQYLYEDDAGDLLRDLSTWASAPVGRTRHGTYGDEVEVSSGSDEIAKRRSQVVEGARAFATGAIGIRELWEIWHHNVVALVDDHSLEGDYRALSSGLRAWEEAEADERQVAEDRVRVIARRLGNVP